MLANQFSRKIAVLGYNRIPFARHNTSYANASNQDMMLAAMTASNIDSRSSPK